MTSLHSPPLELLILLYQRFFGMRRVALRSLLKSLDSTVIPVEILPRWYNSCVFVDEIWVRLPGSGSMSINRLMQVNVEAPSEHACSSSTVESINMCSTNRSALQYKV